MTFGDPYEHIPCHTDMNDGMGVGEDGMGNHG